MQLHFAHPQWLLYGALACVVLAALFVRAERKRRVALRTFAAANLATSMAPSRRWLRSGLALLGIAMGSIALARPLAGHHWEQVPRQGVDLMFAIDTSKSMRAADLRPDRLTRAKLAVADLVRRFDGDRVGLIAFAGDAFVQAPLTADRDVFLESLDALDTDVIPRGGTDIASAIRAADQAMASEPGHKKVLVLVSDGEDLAGDALATARDAATRGLTIFTVGVGSQHGELIEVTNAAGVRELVRDAAGNPVRSHLDEPMLRSLAQVTGGAYEPLGADGRGLDALYAIVRTRLPSTTGADTARKVYTERYQFPLAIAFASLALELMIAERRRRRRRSGVRWIRTAAVGASLLAIPQFAVAASPTADTIAQYNRGTSSYVRRDFTAAQRQFEAALHTGDTRLQTNAYYDLGNARYRAGQGTLAADRDATIASWRQSIAAYDAALGVTPGDPDATYNRDFVARRLAALEQQRQQEQNQNQNAQGQQNQQGQHGHGRQNQQGQGQQNRAQQGQGQQNQAQQGQGQQNRAQQGQGQQNQAQQGQGQQDRAEQGRGQQAQGQQDSHAQAQAHAPQGPQGQGQQGETQGGPRRADQHVGAPDAAEHSDHAQAGQPGAIAAARAAEQHAAAEAMADASRRAAGDLTRGEAVQLLDSAQSELRPMPIHGRANAHPEPTNFQDW